MSFSKVPKVSRQPLIGVVIMARMRIDAQQVAIDIGARDLGKAQDRESQHRDGDGAGKAQRHQPHIFEPETDRPVIGEARPQR